MMQAPGSPLQIVQITDTHLYAQADGRLLGLDTSHSLREVIGLLRGRHDPELVVATGDLAHDGTVAAYARLREHLGAFEKPVYCLPGNHDESRVLDSELGQPPFHRCRSLLTGGWQMVFLDSSVPGSDNGHLSARELAGLDQVLAAAPDRPALVWLHHQPLPVGSLWLDTMAVDNGDEFFAVIDRHPQVRAVVWGHVHQVFEQRRDDVRLLSAPSTCIQFTPRSEDFSIDLVPPGYRWFELHPDGRFETGVERLAEIPGEIDLSLRGY